MHFTMVKKYTMRNHVFNASRPRVSELQPELKSELKDKDFLSQKFKKNRNNDVRTELQKYDNSVVSRIAENHMENEG